MRSNRLKAGTALAALLAISATTAAAKDSVETVVVTASPIAGKADQFATIVSTLDAKQIAETGAMNIGDALKNIPGVSATGFAAGASRPVIRGFDANRVKILEDGISSSDVSDIGPDHDIPIDPLSARNIEIVRGAATLRYGSQAIGGVVNILNDRVPQALVDGPSAEGTFTFGSNSDLDQQSALIDGAIGDFGFHVDGFLRHAGDYDTPKGRQANSFFNGSGASLGGTYFFSDDTHMGAALIMNTARYGIPSDTTYIDMNQTKLITRSTFAIDVGPLNSITVDGGYANYRHTEVDPTTGPLDQFLNEEWDTRTEAVFGQMGPLSSTAIGFQWQNRDFSANGDARDYLDPTTTKSFAGFAFTEAPLGSALKLQAGGRVEQVDITGTPVTGLFTKTSFTPVSGSVGLLYDATDWLKLGITASSAARAPAVTELFAHGPHDGPNTYEIGDPNLGLERANSLEGTMRVELNAVNFEGSLWTTQFKGYIYGDLDGQTCDESGTCVVGGALDFKHLLYKQQDAKFWGLEGKAEVPLMDAGSGSLLAEFIGDYVRATFNKGGNVPRIPAYKLGAGLSWMSDAFDANVMLLHVGAQNDLGAGDTPTKGYMSLDASFAWRPIPDKEWLEFSLVGHNLTNAVQRNAVSINKDDIILPGRDVQLVLRLKT
ncbi:MAG: TonB-dependent receptor [Alphaproteobacteria bacterium]|nr:TonB-dependent receptor [Alphaproteobacteria bacterium]